MVPAGFTQCPECKMIGPLSHPLHRLTCSHAPAPTPPDPTRVQKGTTTAPAPTVPKK